MNLLLRLIKIVLMALAGRRLPFMGESVVRFRVWPNDLDLNLHLNNGRYLTIMDLGRADLMLRNGAAKAAWAGRWRPMVGAATIRFRRGLGPFRRYELRTRLLCWDQKWLLLEQRFEMAGELHATALVKVIFVGPREKIPPQVVAQVAGHDGASPPMPEAVRSWLEWERQS